MPKTGTALIVGGFKRARVSNCGKVVETELERNRNRTRGKENPAP